MYYVYSPYADRQTDPFAEALVTEKNKVKPNSHTLIERVKGGGTPLKVVGRGDRLYVLVHGRGKMYGCGAYKIDGNAFTLSGMDMAMELVLRGLRNEKINVRLWTCFGGVDAQHPSTNEDAPKQGLWGDPRSFAAKVHAALHHLQRTKISVTSYRELVNLNVPTLQERNGVKKLVSNGAWMTTNGHKTHYAGKSR